MVATGQKMAHSHRVERKVSFIFGRISKDKMKLSRKSTLLLSGLFDSFSPKAKEIFKTSSSDIL